MNPFGTFLIIHFEVGGNSRSLKYQEKYWPAAIDLINMADECDAQLTLQFNPQWIEYILRDQNKLNSIKKWQQHGHEIGLHHHGYDHGDWNGYTNRSSKEHDPKFRGNIPDMMKLMRRLAHPHRMLSGTITDEIFDYPPGIRYDTEGILISHARSKPKWVTLKNTKVSQVGMAFLSFKGNAEKFKFEYLKARKDEVFGVVTHEKDFALNPKKFQDWFKFIRSKGESIKTVSQIIMDYEKVYPMKHHEQPLKYFNGVMGAVKQKHKNDS